LDWECARCLYISVADQEKLPFKLLDELPWNHYCRKMVGYLQAIRSGADVVVDTDDDNLPKSTWQVPGFSGRFLVTPDNRGFVNVYRSFVRDVNIWPRGFPLPLISDPRVTIQDAELASQPAEVGVWQGLADEDPDVDAIYRLTQNHPCRFEERAPLVLGAGTLCPFNSQNTAFRREAFPLLYLPAFVTFRFTDILRGLVAQPILWQMGLRLGFTGATVVQERNPHDYLHDFESELPCYLHAHKIPDLVSSSLHAGASASDNLWNAYTALRKHAIVDDRELKTLSAWLTDLNP
jgi:hypothetical protein